MKDSIFIRELHASDAEQFIAVMQASLYIHSCWVNPPKNLIDFEMFLTKYDNDSNYCFLICSTLLANKILGVVNVTQIIRGVFQNAFLAYYVTHDGYKKDIMFTGLQLVIKHLFERLMLHRLEANIQPDNLASIKLIERVGFVLEGYSKDYLFINGKWRDHKRYALLNNELSYKFS